MDLDKLLKKRKKMKLGSEKFKTIGAILGATTLFFVGLVGVSFYFIKSMTPENLIGQAKERIYETSQKTLENGKHLVQLSPKEISEEAKKIIESNVPEALRAFSFTNCWNSLTSITLSGQLLEKSLQESWNSLINNCKPGKSKDTDKNPVDLLNERLKGV